MDANPDHIIKVEEGAPKKEGHVIVVGNAPLPDGVGSKIDQYDEVVRFNKYNKNVTRSGKKVTYHFMSSSWQNVEGRDPNVKMVQSMANGSLTHAINVFLPHLSVSPQIIRQIEAGEMHFL